MIEIYASVLIALITTLFGPLFVTWVRHRIVKKPKDALVGDLIELEKVDIELQEILDYLNADRVWITQLHNGGHFLHSNKSMKKFSVMYEVTSAGISTISSTLSNIPMTLYSALFKELLTNKKVIVHDALASCNTYGLNNIATSSGTVSFYIVGMFDFGTEFLIGMVGVDYLEETQLTDEQLEYLQFKVEKISGYLSAKYKR